mgnify:CR=1 FL=1
MTLAEILAEETAPRGRLAGQRPNQRLAADADRKLLSMGAGFVDPLSIPSAVTGLVSPETRDAWRGVQAEHPGMAMVGSAAPGMGALMAAGAVPTTIGKLLAAMGLGAGSDVIDEAAGKEGSVDRGTVVKAVTAPIGLAPAKATVPVIAAGAAGVLGSVDPAAAQDLTERQKRRLAERAAGAAIDAKAEDEREEAKSKRIELGKDAADKRERDKAKVSEATAARDEILAKARKPFGETEIGGFRVGPYFEAAMPFVPALLGAVTGAKFGKTAAAGDKSAVEAWKEANKAGLSAVAPSVKQEQATLAAMLQKPYEGGVPMDRILKQTAIPAGAGAVEGGAVANLPEFYNSYLPTDNPERKALEAYRDRLPIDDPERRAIDERIARTEPETPARTAAKKHFNNGDWVPRTLQGAAEGSGVAASVNLGRRMIPFKDGLGKVNAETVQLRNQVGSTVDDTAEMMAKRADVDARFAEGQAGREVAGAKRATDLARTKDFYGSDEYGEGITKGLSAREAKRLEQQQIALEQQQIALEQQMRGRQALGPSGAGTAGQPPPGGSSAHGRRWVAGSYGSPVPPVAPVAPVADLQPRGVTVPNQAGPSSSPVARLEESTASALPNQPQNSGMITADPNDLSKLIRAATDYFEKSPVAPVAPVAGQRALPSPKPRGRGGQIDPYNTPVQGPAGSASPAEAARDVYLQASASGKPTTGRGGSLTKDEFPAKVTDELRTRTGVDDPTGLSKQAQHNRRVDAEKQIEDLAKREGIPYREATQRYYDANPLFDTSTGLRRNVPALSVGGLAAGASMDRSQEQSVLDEVMKQYMGGRGLDQITASDVQGKIEDQSAVDGVLGRLRGKVGGLSTKGEQLRAIRDARNGGLMESDTSPTGYRDPSGRFAAGGSP